MSYLTQEQLGQRIAELRTERGVSQRRLADVLGLDPSALSRIESGERGLAVGELVSGAEFLGVDPDVLLRDEVDVTPLFRNEGGPGQGTQPWRSSRRSSRNSSPSRPPLGAEQWLRPRACARRSRQPALRDTSWGWASISLSTISS